MRTILGVLVTGVGLLVVGETRSDDQADMKAVIDKAVKAHGHDKLAHFKGMSAAFKGKFTVGGMTLAMSGERVLQPPTQSRLQADIEVNGMQIKFVQIVNADKGWFQAGDQTTEMPKDQLAEAQEQQHAESVVALLPLRNKEYKLSPLGESILDKKEVVGVQVSRKDRRDVNLFFDKKGGLLLKMETRAKDVQTVGQEFTSETFYHDYKMIDGIPHPTRLVIKHDGKDFGELELSDFKAHEKLDDSVFAKP